jgi:amyloid beta precursor protein binding protein 1
MAQALKRFVKRHGVLPLVGSVPDMKADTNRYVQLQNLYNHTYNK